MAIHGRNVAVAPPARPVGARVARIRASTETGLETGAASVPSRSVPLNFPGWIRNAWLSVLAVLNGRRKHRGWGRFLLILVTGLTGFELQAGNVAYVDLGQPAQLWRGRSEASSPDPGAWRGVGFVDATWERVAMPVFSGLALVGTELADMPGQYSSIFVRRTFVVNEPAAVLTLELGTFCTGGCIAWINGQEVYRTNVPAGDPVLGGVAGGTNGTPAAFVTQELALTPGLLVGGTNVLAIQAFARAPGPGWSFVFDTSLTAIVDEEPPVMVDLVPEAGRALRELNFVEVVFSEPVTGVTAEDLLINDHPATNVVEVAAGDFLFAIEPPADGLVTLAWRAGHDITDTGPLHRPFAGGSWHYNVDSTSPASDVVISEFMADNKRTLHDEDGDSPDWIELYNGGANTASLAGWFLTDSRTNPTKWTFPAVDLPAGGYLVVYASAKNRVNPLGRLHTNFKLGSDGGYLALFDSRTNLASDFGASYPRQSTDVSYGRAPGENRAVGYFTKPTPGALNVSSGPGFAPAVEFSRAGGPFTNAFALVLRTGLSNAIVRYTMDGSLPTNSSPVFSAPIAVTNSLQVRARAFADGLLPGPPRSEAYLLLSPNVLGFSSDLPVMVLHSLGRGAPTSGSLRYAQMSLFEPRAGVTRLTDPPVLNQRLGAQLRGSSTEGLPKSSYKLELWDEFGTDQKHELLGLPAESDWVLYAPNQFDPILIHNPFIHQLSRDMGRYSSRTRFVEVYFNRGVGPVSTANYMGIYVLEEKIKIGPDRVDIDQLEAENLTPPSITGGYLLKIDRLDPGDSGISAGGVTIGHVDPKERDLRLAQRRPQQTYIRDYFNAYTKALSSTNWLDPNLGYRAYFDVEAAIDFHVLEVLSGNVDTLVLSTYFHKPRNGRITFGPHWDFDRALGSTDGRDYNPRIWTTGPFFSASWWSRIFADKDFWQRWVDRWQELRDTHFALTNLHAIIDRFTGEVRQAQPREYAKWRVTLRGGSYASEINWMKNWVSNRVDFIDRQLTQPARFSHPGGPVAAGQRVTVTGPAGATLYYTLDGTDPRATGGAISPKARIYSTALTISGNARLVVRAYDTTKKQVGGPPTASSTPWSRPAAATYVVTTPPLLLTEIMFHPADPPLGSAWADADFEFL